MAQNHLRDDDERFTATAVRSEPTTLDDDRHSGAYWQHLGGRLQREGLIQVLEPLVRRGEYQGETPFEGRGAVARWLALHDRARELRAALRPGDLVGERQVRRAIRSLFLYEHQLTPKTRRQARTVLWRRERPDEPLAPFVARVGWSRCRCVRCQPQTATKAARAGAAGEPPAGRAGLVLQSA